MAGLGDHLLVDLYEFTMVQGYVEADMLGPAAFELFVRRLPRTRNFLVGAGLEQVLQFLEQFELSEADLGRLEELHPLSTKARDYLRGLRFSGDVDAVPEGTLVFAEEPIVRVTAALPQAQLVETRLMNLIHFQTVVASKAARAVIAAAGKPLVDFGLRRAHGSEAGTLGARAMYLAGFAGTSNVRAGMEFGIPISGTMAHSFVQAHDDEGRAFLDFAAATPGQPVTFLIDTYDTNAAARKVVDLAPELARRGVKIGAVRIDSGDLALHARQVRRILDEGGLQETGIVASSGLDEHQIAELVASDAPIDRFAPGTKIITSADAPHLDCAYKLVEYEGRARLKRSEGKRTWPGRKQIWRRRGGNGTLLADYLTQADERVAGAAPLLAPVMRSGGRIEPARPIAELRARVAGELAGLPPALRDLLPGPSFAPTPSEALLRASTR